MKTKALALLLAMLMLACLAFTGCGAKELAPEEYVKKAIDVSMAEATKKIEPVKVTLGVGDILPILEMAGQDTSAIPPVEDIALDFYAGSDTDFVMQLSALVNHSLCDAMVGYKVADNEVVASSNLVSSTYGVKLEDLLVGMTMPSVTEMKDSYLALVEPVYDSILKNSTVTKTEGKGEVTVHLAMDAEGIINMAIEVMELLANDAFFADYFSTVAYTDINEVVAEMKADKDDIIAEGNDLGIALTLDMVINKSTYMMTGADMTFTADGQTMTMDMVNKEGDMSVKLDIPETASISYSALYTKDTLDLDVKVVSYDYEAFTMTVDADGKEAVAKINVPSEGVEVTAKADYTVSKNGFAATLTSVGMDGVALDVSDMGITLSAESGASVPAIPDAEKNLFEMSEDELELLGQEFILNLVSKAGLLSYMQ